MQTNKILSSSLIELIFDGRNKEYGAYDLRITYPRRIKKSLLLTTIIFGLAFGGAVLASTVKKNNDRYAISQDMNLTSVDEAKKPEKLPEPVKKEPEPEQVKTEKVTPPIITPDDEVKVPPPSQNDLLDAKIGDTKIDGKIDDGIPKPENPGQGTGIIEDKPKPESDEIVTFVEIDAKYNGNWKVFLERNLNANVPLDNGAPPGRYSVVFKFVVDKQGNVSDIQALTEHGYGMEAEALRVLRKAAKWEPAIQNGYQVKAYKKQVIIFEVPSEE